MPEVVFQKTFKTEIQVSRRGAQAFCRELAESEACFFVVDGAVWRHVKNWIDEFSSPTLVLPMHELEKNLDTTRRILSWMQDQRFRRRDRLVVVGGGTLIDTAGLAAALYLRGVPYSLVPTTLVAQVDAAIGGKVGVNFGSAKNSLGAFWHPDSVVVDPTLLSSLLDRDFRAGIAECIKVACADPSGAEFAYLEDNTEAIIKREASAVDNLVRQSIDRKLTLLRDDPFEADLNRLLNFGHTVAHALEHATGYQTYLHGEAVAIGIATACRFASGAGHIDNESANRILHLLDEFDLPVSATNEVSNEVLSALESVFMARGGQLRYVVPTAIGHLLVVPASPVDVLGRMTDLARRTLR